MRTRHIGLVLAGLIWAASPVAAQPLGTFRWQLQPFCNVVTVAITQNGPIYRLEGTDDQCGNGADAASVTGTAFPNADGTIGFGLNIVTAPGGRPVHVDAEITLGTFGGTWRDSAGGTGAFVLTPGAGNGGAARPLPPPTAAALPATLILRQDGGVVASGTQGSGAIPASGGGARMMWYPGKLAFRAGSVNGDQWDDAKMGLGSVAFGIGTVASGDGSMAVGQLAVASGFSSLAQGSGVASGNGSVAMGNNTSAAGLASTATGIGTIASGRYSTAMGASTTASGPQSVATGRVTIASGDGALAGGDTSVASGASALAFGQVVRAEGDGSVALGTNATAAANGSFVFADRSAFTELRAPLANQFLVRAGGGARFFSNAGATLGVELAPNGTQWSSLSDVNAKHRFRDLDGDEVLRRFATMPVREWSYKAQDDAIRHIGPTAQDFHAAFGLGEEPLRIGTLDADGVALAGVKAVEARTRTLRDEHEALRQRVADLEQALADALAALRALKGGQ